MLQEIRTINLSGVNCYLLKAGGDYLLVDTGFANKRATLDKKLTDAGCRPGNLKLIVLTHGDEDHTGNAAYLRENYGARIAMHADDSPMVERGDMQWNRKTKPDKFSIVFKILSVVFPLFIKSGKFETFKPDISVDDGFDLAEYGFNARIIHTPGHSKGSISVLTTGGDLCCGDLLYNIPGFNFIDDLADFKGSIEKLKKLNVKMVFPGHGKPFPAKRLTKLNSSQVVRMSN